MLCAAIKSLTHGFTAEPAVKEEEDTNKKRIKRLTCNARYTPLNGSIVSDKNND
jgi:hypothetical protein